MYVCVLCPGRTTRTETLSWGKLINPLVLRWTWYDELQFFLVRLRLLNADCRWPSLYRSNVAAAATARNIWTFLSFFQYRTQLIFIFNDSIMMTETKIQKQIAIRLLAAATMTIHMQTKAVALWNCETCIFGNYFICSFLSWRNSCVSFHILNAVIVVYLRLGHSIIITC